MSRGRRDVLVILARGASARMGRPKGLLGVPGRPGESFVGALVATYGSLVPDGIVVTTPDLAGAYRAALGPAPGVEVVAAAAGGGTAATLAAALAAMPTGATHAWLQPVDMPLVAAGTLEILRDASRRRPAQVVRPEYRGRPGHPVVLPVALAAELVAGPAAGQADVRELLAAGVPVAVRPVDDPGAVHDFDTPADLAPAGDPRKETP